MSAAITRLLLVSGCICLTTVAAAQQVPNLSGDQRRLLAALVTAVDAAADTGVEGWQTHVLRASDGSHYIALAIASTPENPISRSPLIVYVRLSTALTLPETALTERSVVREWLAGARIDPRLLPRRGFAIGEMPAMGAGTIGGGGSATVGSADLQIMALQRERARQRKADEERQRRAALQGAGVGAAGLLPFEDFDLVTSSAFADGTRAIERALTAGPGQYHLSVGWVEAAATPDKATVRVVRRTLDLPPAPPDEFRVSSVIVADAVSVRGTPYTAAEQRAHPYAIGPTEITPARDAVFTRDEQLSIAFQVINARASEAGKPDVTVTFRITRLVGAREQQVATLTPLRYDATTLPPDFDVRLGHPIIAAMSVPLATLPRGDFRLHIAATDHPSTTTTGAVADFRVVGTPLSLLAEAPPLEPRFRRETVFEGDALAAMVQTLQPASPSPALSRALAAARERRFVDLMREDAVPEVELAVRTALTAIGLYSFGDASASLQLQRAAQLGAPPGPLRVLEGAWHAAEGRDAAAADAWRAAIEGGFPNTGILPLLSGAYLRQGDAARALQAATAWREQSPDAAWWRPLAAAYLSANRPADAISILELRLRAQADDLDAQWLLLHALYASIARSPDQPRPDGNRFVALARAYAAAGGAQGALAAEWVKMVERF